MKKSKKTREEKQHANHFESIKSDLSEKEMRTKHKNQRKVKEEYQRKFMLKVLKMIDNSNTTTSTNNNHTLISFAFIKSNVCHCVCVGLIVCVFLVIKVGSV